MRRKTGNRARSIDILGSFYFFADEDGAFQVLCWDRWEGAFAICCTCGGERDGWMDGRKREGEVKEIWHRVEVTVSESWKAGFSQAQRQWWMFVYVSGYEMNG